MRDEVHYIIWEEVEFPKRADGLEDVVFNAIPQPDVGESVTVLIDNKIHGMI
jgi:hypothetical protein